MPHDVYTDRIEVLVIETGIDTADSPSARDPLYIHCVHSEKDMEISATTAAAKVESLQLLEVGYPLTHARTTPCPTPHCNHIAVVRFNNCC